MSISSRGIICPMTTSDRRLWTGGWKALLPTVPLVLSLPRPAAAQEPAAWKPRDYPYYPITKVWPSLLPRLDNSDNQLKARTVCFRSVTNPPGSWGWVNIQEKQPNIKARKVTEDFVIKKPIFKESKLNPVKTFLVQDFLIPNSHIGLSCNIYTSLAFLKLKISTSFKCRSNRGRACEKFSLLWL